MKRIAVDAMGGDFAPEEVIKGLAGVPSDRDVYFILAGDRDRLEPLLDRYRLSVERCEIAHAPDVIGMDEPPREALDAKPDSSIAVAARILADGEADALLSAGNTGAVVLASRQYVPMIEGIERSALATIYPTANFKSSKFGHAFFLDAGATLHCDVRHLVHFALMGHFYSKDILGIENPRIGLLNVGSEPSKGGRILSTVHRLLSENSALNFIGNIEGKDILGGHADVVVCEGMVGNIVIKTLEGISESCMNLAKFAYKKRISFKLGLALLSSGIKKVKERTDYTEYGGAPILGFRRPCIKAHGRSNAKAITAAVNVAVTAITSRLCDKIRDSIAEFNRHLPFNDE